MWKFIKLFKYANIFILRLFKFQKLSYGWFVFKRLISIWFMVERYQYRLNVQMIQYIVCVAADIFTLPSGFRSRNILIGSTVSETLNVLEALVDKLKYFSKHFPNKYLAMRCVVHLHYYRIPVWIQTEESLGKNMEIPTF